jgi:hypothetical protein
MYYTTTLLTNVAKMNQGSNNNLKGHCFSIYSEANLHITIVYLLAPTENEIDYVRRRIGYEFKGAQFAVNSGYQIGNSIGPRSVKITGPLADKINAFKDNLRTKSVSCPSVSGKISTAHGTDVHCDVQGKFDLKDLGTFVYIRG